MLVIEGSEGEKLVEIGAVPLTGNITFGHAGIAAEEETKCGSRRTDLQSGRWSLSRASEGVRWSLRCKQD